MENCDASPNISVESPGGYGHEGRIHRTAVDFAIEARCEKPLWSFFQDSHAVALTNYGRRKFLAENPKGKGKSRGK